MPKYYNFMIGGYYLYFTAFCTIECMHVHASDRGLSEDISAKIWVKDNGDTVVQRKGILKDRELLKIRKFVKEHYAEMYLFWEDHGGKGFYRGE